MSAKKGKYVPNQLPKFHFVNFCHSLQSTALVWQQQGTFVTEEGLVKENIALLSPKRNESVTYSVKELFSEGKLNIDKKKFLSGPNEVWSQMFYLKTEYQTGTAAALTVLGELGELSISSGESSSSSGSVGMAGCREGRERVCGKKKGVSAAGEASPDSLKLQSLCSRGDVCSKSRSSSWSYKHTENQIHAF